MSDFLRAFAIGVAVAAPLGPLGILCVQRTLARGWRAGLATGFGVASADAVFATLGALGMGDGRLSGAPGIAVRLGGAALLLYIAWQTISRQFAPLGAGDGVARVASAAGDAGRYASAFALTMSNPLTILEFAAIFAGLGLSPASHAAVPVFVAGVALGSMSWWALLTGAVTTFRARVSAGVLARVNTAAAALLVGVALWLLWGVAAPAVAAIG